MKEEDKTTIIMSDTDTPEYYLRKLITSLYGREDYLADTIRVISATDELPEQPEGLAIPVQITYENKKFDRVMEQVAILLKKLAVKQYLKKERNKQIDKTITNYYN